MSNIPQKAEILLLKRKSKGWLEQLKSGDPFKFLLIKGELFAENIATLAELSGADRIGVVMDPDDYVRLFFFSEAIASNKKVFVLQNKELLDRFDHFVVAHELSHTLPFIWSSDQMVEECGFDYHNKDEKIAHGLRITYGGDIAKEFTKPNYVSDHDNGYSIMSSIMLETSGLPYAKNVYAVWIDQCTYTNLVKILQKQQDPELILVRGMILRYDEYSAVMLPSYKLNGTADLEEGEGNWMISVVSDSGRKNYAFEPQWNIHADTVNDTIDIERNALSFGYKIPFIESIKKIELIGPSGTLDEIVLSEYPSVDIESSEKIDDVFKISWKGSDPVGDELLYSVFYSDDEGETWQARLFETEDTKAEIQVSPNSQSHSFKVVATDGGLSSEDAVIKVEQKVREPLDLIPLVVVVFVFVLFVIWRLRN